MSDSSQFHDEHERQLDAIIARYYRAVEEGLPPDQDKFAAQHPEFEKDLCEFFADLGHLHGAVPHAEENPALSDTVTMKAPQLTATRRPSVVRYFGEYEILGELGIGGMGVVYKARQTKLRRIVALKMIKAGELANPQDVQRFQAEAKAVARLSHPGIVAVHEVGIHQGQYFYTMDFVGGGNLSKLHHDGPVSARRAAELVRQLAEAVHHAHGEGIVHRDLKPANVLLTEDGAPRITDFGLAKRMWVGEDSLEAPLTETGQILGTAGYMSPEQAAGKTRLVGPPADIYALGSILYALLTSRAPFVGESLADTIQQVIHKEPVSPRALNPSIARDLETICLKCLEKEPHKRYGTAQLLADDLGRFLEGRPVVARPISRAARTWRWCRRNPLVAGLITTVATTLLIGTAVSWYFADQNRQSADANFELAGLERKARQVADQRKREAEASAQLAETRRKESDEYARLARRHLYCAHMNLTQKYWDEGRIGAVLKLLERHRPEKGEEDLRGFEWHYWQRRCHSELLLFGGHTSFVATVAFNSEGTRIVTASHDRTVKVWDASSGDLKLTLIGHSDAVRCAVFSPDSTKIASASYDGTVRLWDAASGQKLRLIEHPRREEVECVAFSPDGTTLASASRDGIIRLWAPSSGELKSRFNSPQSRAWGVAFSPDGKWIASAHDSGARVWDVDSSTVKLTLNGHSGVVRKVGFSPNGTTIATAGYDGTVKLWDTTSGSMTQSLTGHASAINWVAFSPDGDRIASASSDQTIKIWDATSGRELLALKGHTSYVTGIAFSPDGARIASACWDKTVKMWDAITGVDTLTLTGHRGIVNSVSFSPNGTKLVSGGTDTTIKLWDTSSGSELRTLIDDIGSITCVAFNSDGTRFASASGLTIKIWETETGALLKTLTGHGDQVNSVAYNRKGDWIVTASHDGTLKIWNATDGKLVKTLTGHSGRIHEAFFSPDGNQIASASADRTVKVWDTSTGIAVRTFSHTEPVMSVAFSSSSTRLASGSGSNTVKLWDSVTGKELFTVLGHTNDLIYKVTFSPDGARFASASGDGTINVWDSVTGAELMTLHGRTRHVYDLAFSPDGLRVASANYDGIIKIWNASVPRLGMQTTAEPVFMK